MQDDLIKAESRWRSRRLFRPQRRRRTWRRWALFLLLLATALLVAEGVSGVTGIAEGFWVHRNGR